MTDSEFINHSNDCDREWLCDCCVANNNFKALYNLPHYHPIKEQYEIKQPKTSIFNTAKKYHGDFISRCSDLGFSMEDTCDNNNITTQINSNYFDVQEFKNQKFNESNDFSVCHINISSLDKHIDELRLTISRIKHKFDIIGISEHKIPKDGEASNNIKLQGYHDFIFSPTASTHGGTGFYIKNVIDYIPRKDLEINNDTNHESSFIELKFNSKKDMIIGCIYRHPSASISISDFADKHIEPILNKISLENKPCMIMGDYNINLLMTDSNNAYNNFYNTFSSNHFSPFVLQPSRLRCKTIINNIFFNSLNHCSKVETF